MKQIFLLAALLAPALAGSIALADDAKADPTLVQDSEKYLRDDEKALLAAVLTHPDAAAQFIHATQIDPSSAAAWNDLAVASNLACNDSTALAALDRLRALHAEKPGHLYERAIILDKVHDLKPALAAYREFLSAAAGKFPDEEFKSRQRARIIEDELNRR